ncbi:hypothetical protein BBM55_15340 [Vibrio parahaemolyticus]|nr:hypothetical protein BBM55_15340 [Vibrio parahaemolyticus]
MFKKKHEENKIDTLANISSSLESIAAHLDSEQENKYKATCDLMFKTFEHERQKASKIEDKANKIVTFLLTVSTAYLAFFIWFVQSGYSKLPVLLDETAAPLFVLALLSAGGLALLASINKAFAVMWAQFEHNPVGDFKLFHKIDKEDAKTIDVYKFYAEHYSAINEKRTENNLKRGQKLSEALNLAKYSMYGCLIIGAIVLMLTSPVF